MDRHGHAQKSRTWSFRCPFACFQHSNCETFSTEFFGHEIMKTLASLSRRYLLFVLGGIMIISVLVLDGRRARRMSGCLSSYSTLLCGI